MQQPRKRQVWIDAEGVYRVVKVGRAWLLEYSRHVKGRTYWHEFGTPFSNKTSAVSAAEFYAYG